MAIELLVDSLWDIYRRRIRAAKSIAERWEKFSGFQIRWVLSLLNPDSAQLIERKYLADSLCALERFGK